MVNMFVDNSRESKDGAPNNNSIPHLVLMSGRTAEGLQKALSQVSRLP